MKDYRWAWWKLCVQVGLGHWECKKCGQAITGRKCCESGFLGDRKYIGLFSHDMRRSAARSYRKAGVAESVIMEMCGWETAAMFKRYDIVDNKDKVEAVRLREQKRILERESEISHDLPILARAAKVKKTAKAAN